METEKEGTEREINVRRMKSSQFFTCNRASSPSCEQDKVGVVPRKPLSVTSSTVSPIDNTRVAFIKDTTMYESNSSVKEKKQFSLTVHRE